MPTSAFAKLQAQPGKRDELITVLHDLLAAAEQEPGTIQYLLHTDDTNADVVWFYELYADKDAAAAHSTSDAMKAAFPKLAPLLGGRAEITTATPVAGKGSPVPLA